MLVILKLKASDRLVFLCVNTGTYFSERTSQDDKMRIRLSEIKALDQTWAKYGPRDDFMRPAGSYKKMNWSTEDAKTFSFAPHLYFRRTQDIQWKTGYARI